MVPPPNGYLIQVSLIVTIVSPAAAVLVREDDIALGPVGAPIADAELEIPDLMDLVPYALAVRGDADALGMRARAQQRGALPFNPMVVISSGCSGSSHAGNLLRRLLKARGINLYNVFRLGGDWELTVPRKNPEYNDRVGIPEAIRLIGERSASENKTLVFKASPKDMTPELATTIHELGGQAILYWRNNPLDKLVCHVRDCFGRDRKGTFSVDDHGERSNLCFKRRHSDQVIKAQLNVSDLASRLRSAQDFVPRMLEQMALTDLPLTEQHVFDFDTLYDFEEAFSLSGDAGLQRSASAWRRILSIFGVEMDTEEIADVLRPDAGKWHRELHNVTVFNIEEVARCLQEEANVDLLQYLRI